MDIDGPSTDDSGVPPHLLEEQISRDDAAGALHEIREEIELGRGEHDLRPIHRDAASCSVEGDATEDDDVLRFRGARMA
jgi:hypothetical protein